MARPTEIRRVAELLTAGAESPEELAKAVIAELDNLRADRATYCVVTEWKGRGSAYFGYGPYATDHQARKAAESGKLPLAALGTRSVIVKMFAPLHAAKSLEEVDQ